MNGVSFTPASIEDIGDIWDYTATMWGIDQADYYLNNIRDCCSDLASGRKKGAHRSRAQRLFEIRCR